jgi:hypothetical protein
MRFLHGLRLRDGAAKSKMTRKLVEGRAMRYVHLFAPCYSFLGGIRARNREVTAQIRGHLHDCDKPNPFVVGLQAALLHRGFFA